MIALKILPALILPTLTYQGLVLLQLELLFTAWTRKHPCLYNLLLPRTLHEVTVISLQPEQLFSRAPTTYLARLWQLPAVCKGICTTACPSSTATPCNHCHSLGYARGRWRLSCDTCALQDLGMRCKEAKEMNWAMPSIIYSLAKWFPFTVAHLLEESFPIHHCSYRNVTLPARARPLFPKYPQCAI